MAVRGTTHARHMRRVIVRDAAAEGERIWCAWEDCDQHGYINYEFRVNEAKPGFPVQLARYVFCCEAHRQYFARSHVPGEYGRLRGINPRYR